MEGLTYPSVGSSPGLYRLLSSKSKVTFLGAFCWLIRLARRTTGLPLAAAHTLSKPVHPRMVEVPGIEPGSNVLLSPSTTTMSVMLFNGNEWAGRRENQVFKPVRCLGVCPARSC